MGSWIEINGRRIGAGCPTYIIAEMSANHGQSFEQAVEILEAAKETGADAIKLQTYTPDTLTLDCDNDCFRIDGTLWHGRTLYDLYGEACTPWDWQPRLKEIAARIGLELFSTPFDDTAVEFLERMNVPAYKVASFENGDLPLLRRIARAGKPVIMSTGMASVGELTEAVQTLQQAGCRQLALLKCTSAYPAPPEAMNLRAIPHLAGRFDLPVGLSDHTLGVSAPVAAVALGACIIEKHFTLSRSQPGPDNAFSLEPREFKTMVDGVRLAEKALGEAHYGLSPAEEASRVFRRSLFVTADVKAGEALTSGNVRSIRPGHGLHPRHFEEVLGCRATRDIKRGTPLAWEMVGEKRATPSTMQSGGLHGNAG
ncbi:MAG: pseudaminic acid synthase [Deltaproteobacteria bacterium]|nr:pseudaminic acid synthase [Deltaproteobacteria bacterium]